MMTLMTMPMPRSSPVCGMAEPERAGVVPMGLLVNHHGFRLRLHEHTPKGERKGNDRDD
jgi:hypothetical protein